MNLFPVVNFFGGQPVKAPRPAPVAPKPKPAKKAEASPMFWVGYAIDEDFKQYKAVYGEPAAQKLLDEAHDDMCAYLNRRP